VRYLVTRTEPQNADRVSDAPAVKRQGSQWQASQGDGKEVKRMLEFIQYGIPAYFQGVFHTVRNREEGQALVEYALVLALISVVAILVLTAIGVNVVAKLGQVRDALA
jgi:pilus assembly protein Flp/PilA